MRQRERLGKRIKRALELDELIDEQDALEMRGSYELDVRRVVRFLHYSETEIRLLLKAHILKVTGEKLFCSSYLLGMVRVSGSIHSLEIERREGGGKTNEK